MPLSSLTGKLSTILFAQASNDNANPLVSGVSSTATLNKQVAVSTSVANAVAGGSDEVFTFQQALTAGSSATIDLNAMTNMLGQAAVALGRIKSWQIRLLSAADDPSLSPAPTATTVVVVTNSGPATPHPLCFNTGGSGLTVALTGAGAVTAVAIGAAGTLYPKSSFFLASPVQAGGSGCLFLVTTNSSGVPTAVTFLTGVGGAGYSAATVPSVVVGQARLVTGGVLAFLDPTAAGTVVSATSNNFKVMNSDATNACTLEIDFFGGTS